MEESLEREREGELGKLEWENFIGDWRKIVQHVIKAISKRKLNFVLILLI